MQLIDTELLDSVTSKAKESPRLRMNHNFHESLDAKAQRLLNALEPGTILPIHRHQETAETYILLRGKVKVIFYNEQKEVTETAVLDPQIGNYGIHIPKGQWHTLEVLESGSMIFEVKDGPYKPFAPEDVL
ncbi:MAG: WbuC family cupin fold metalloprotein [Parabacteroides sp.]|nr:WbuC family cupin fold metalloprotein [Parabacteroides sp.]